MKIGTKSVCATCGREVVYLGKYWDHISGTYRHSANPSESVLLTSKIAAKRQELLELELQLEQLNAI